MPSRRRRALFGLVVASVLLVALEAGLGFVLPPAGRSMATMRIPKPGAPFVESADGAVHVAYQTDPVPDFPHTPDPARPRVLVLGESTVRGARDSNIPISLAAELARVGMPAEVINLGYPGGDSTDLVGVARASLPFAPALAVLHFGHNDVGNVYMREHFGVGSGHWFGRAGTLIERLNVVRAARLGLAPTIGRASPTLYASVRRRAPMDAGKRAATAERFAENLRAIIGTYREAGVPVVVSTVISDIGRFGTGVPACAELLPGAWVPAAGGFLELRGEVARETVDAALALDPRCPEALFLRGEARLARGDTGGLADLRAARDNDVVPLRGTEEILTAIRAVAASEGVALVDLDAVAHARAPLEASYFADLLHPNARGSAWIAERLAPAVREVLEEPGALRPDR